MKYASGKSMPVGKKGGGAKRGSGGVRTPFTDRLPMKGR